MLLPLRHCPSSSIDLVRELLALILYDCFDVIRVRVIIVVAVFVVVVIVLTASPLFVITNVCYVDNIVPLTEHGASNGDTTNLPSDHFVL